MNKTLLIFDMDGVLVEPGRYRAALKGTLDYFGNLMGWDYLYPGETAIAWFESRGIISEWDIAPIYLAVVFETILASFPNLELPADLISACKFIKVRKILKPEFALESHIDHLPGMMASGATFCERVIQINHANPQNPAFFNLANSPIFYSLLKDSRNVLINLVTRIFQEMFLGKEEFEKTFHLAAVSENQYASQINDRSIISAEWNQKLIEHWQSKAIKMAIYTARPSSPKFCDVDGILQYSPEADIVIDQLGWQQIPLIGLGQLKYAADQIGCMPEDLIKPSPVHALGAIGAAFTGQTLPAIQAGWDLMNQKNSTFFDSLPDLDVHIFEDSPTGITGVIQAVDILRKRGVSIKLTKWGITSDTNKMDRLLLQGANIMATVNDALDSIKENIVIKTNLFKSLDSL